MLITLTTSFLAALAGVVLYYALPFEPSYVALWGMCVGGAVLCIPAWYSARLQLLGLLAVALLMLGYTGLRSHHNVTPHVPDSMGTVWIRGTVHTMEETDTHTRIMLSKPDLWTPETKRFSAQHTPRFLRLNVRTQIAPDVVIGSRISTKAVLTPPTQKPIVPGGYDFRFIAHHRQIGGVGYSVADVLLYGEQPDHVSVMQLRQNVAARIHRKFEHMGWENPDTSAIANALLTGKRHTISDKVQETIRETGLGHLLAISGLHMALIMLSSFWCMRRLSNLIPAISLRYNVKSIAAGASIIMGAVYLILSGLPISAQRAYIMACLFFVAVIFARVHNGKRLVVIAGWIVLLIAPYQVVGPSFQMSFMAVWLLICVFSRPKFAQRAKQLPWYKAMFRYVAMLMLSSMVANIAVLPFSLQHFGAYSLVGVVANIIAIPLASIWIMPAGLMAIILMPFGLEMPALYVMGLGLDFLQFYASFLHHLELTQLRVPTPHGLLVVVAVIGIMLATLSRFIRVGMVLYIGAILAMFAGFFFRPDVVVLEEKKGVIMRHEGAYSWWKRPRSGFARDMAAHYLGVPEINAIKPQQTLPGIVCKKILCSTAEYKIAFYKNMALTHAKTGQKLKISAGQRNMLGAHAIWITDDGFDIRTIKDRDANRIWTQR